MIGCDDIILGRDDVRYPLAESINTLFASFIGTKKYRCVKSILSPACATWAYQFRGESPCGGKKAMEAKVSVMKWQTSGRHDSKSNC